MKESLVRSINKASFQDDLDISLWKDLIVPEEKQKLDYEQKVKNLNSVLINKEIYLDYRDVKMYEFLEHHVQHTLTPKQKEIKGYEYNGRPIIKRGRLRTFYLIEGPDLDNFLIDVRNIIDDKAKSKFVTNVYTDVNTESLARDYIYELREEQKNQISSVKNPKETNEKLKEINIIESEINQIKKNKSFKLRVKVFNRSMAGRFRKLFRWLWQHKGKVAGISAVLIPHISGLSTFTELSSTAKKGIDSVKSLGNSVVKMARDIKKSLDHIDNYLNLPASVISNLLLFVGSIIKTIHYITRYGYTNGISITFGVLGVGIKSLVYLDEFLGETTEKGEFFEKTGKSIEDKPEKLANYYRLPSHQKSVVDLVKSVSVVPMKYIGETTTFIGETIIDTIFYIKIGLAIFIIIILIKWIQDF